MLTMGILLQAPSLAEPPTLLNETLKSFHVFGIALDHLIGQEVQRFLSPCWAYPFAAKERLGELLESCIRTRLSEALAVQIHW
jgi:hypothetical protein